MKEFLAPSQQTGVMDQSIGGTWASPVSGGGGVGASPCQRTQVSIRNVPRRVPRWEMCPFHPAAGDCLGG